MTVGQDFPPEVVQKLEKISASLDSFSDAMRKLRFMVNSDDQEVSAYQTCATHSEYLYGAIVCAAYEILKMPECPNSLLSAMMQGLPLARFADDAGHVLHGDFGLLKEDKYLCHAEVHNLLTKADAYILEFRLAMRIAGVNLDVTPITLDDPRS